MILCGDLNVAHEEIDLANPKANVGNPGFSYEEREKFSLLLEAGFTDSFRHLYPEQKDAYSWWSYRMRARERNVGWRIDYFVVSRDLAPAIEDSRNGLGLGMTLVGATATAHGGTVLLDHPTPEQTRVTLTIPVKKPRGTEVRSPKIPIGDYAGGRDKALLEFADLLSTDAYNNI